MSSSLARIAEGGDTDDAIAPDADRLAQCGRAAAPCANGPGRPSSRARNPRSHRSMKWRARLEGREAETIAVVGDVDAIEPLDHRVDPAPRLPRRRFRCRCSMHPPKAGARLQLGLPTESRTSQAPIRSAPSRPCSGRRRSRERRRSPTKRLPRSKRQRTRASTGTCSIPKRASQAPAMRRDPRAVCCRTTSSGTSAATS